MVTAHTVNICRQVMRRPGSQCVGKTAGDIFAIMYAVRNRVLPDGETAVIVAGRTVHAGMPAVFSRAHPSVGIMAVSARCWRAVRTMTPGTFPTSVDRRFILFGHDFKAVLPFMTVGA